MIEPGKFGEVWKAQVRCGCCGALVEIEAEDVSVSLPGEDYDGGYSFGCPVCCAEVHPKKQLGLSVYQMAAIKKLKKGERP